MSLDLTNELVSEGFQHLLQVRREDKTLFDALGNTLDDFRLSGSFTTSEFLEIENGTSQTGNKLHSRSGTLYWGNKNLETGGSGLGNLVEDTTPQLGGDLDANSNDILMGNQAIKFGSSKWEIVLDTGDNELLFKYNSTTVFKLGSNGAVTSANNVTAFGTSL